MKSPLLRLFLIIMALQWASHSSQAQNWISGYSYRKKITINKDKVLPTIDIYGNSVTEVKDLIDFPVLIEVSSEDLRHISGACGNKIQSSEGRDITFTLTNSTAPLDFQLESYDADAGKLTCWVKIPVLSAQGTPSPATSLYLYYGSAMLHNPFEARNMGIWSADYTRVWHMNQDVGPAITKNAKTNTTQQELKGSNGIDASNYIDSKTGKGISIDGATESLNSNTENSTAVTITAWVKLNAIGHEQMLICNDSIRTVSTTTIKDGYNLKVNAAGQMTFEIYKNSAAYAITAQTPLTTNTWYYVCCQSNGLDINLSINGIKAGGRLGTTIQRLGPGGSIKVGSSKVNSNYLNGELDEIRIQSTLRRSEWVKTEYTNQLNPQGFYTISEEEYNPAGFSRFLGTTNNLWSLPVNWSNGFIPTPNTNIIVSAGKTLDLAGAANLVVNRLTLESNAVLKVNNALEVNCNVNIAKDAEIRIDNNAVLKLNADVINNGFITSGQTNGKLLFAGQKGSQHFAGEGTTRVSGIEINQLYTSCMVELGAPIDVYDEVVLTRGSLNANANLTLLSTQNTTASIAPVANESQLVGDIHVQQYISGDFPSPATARGWRLLSSPVYAKVIGSAKYYDVSAYKKAMFITGNGGTINGFDSSPQNGNTIFIHDQARPGSLSQKYAAFANASAEIETGKGIYVFSRGSRNAPDAYGSQILRAPFANPSGYIITHTGKAYIGELSVNVGNKGGTEEGSGFNLLGNPYAAVLSWEKLYKNNLSQYIWMFDPLNNSYYVSDDPSTVIPSGAGFFVKVIAGSTTGTLTFTEQSKYKVSPLQAGKTATVLPDFKPVRHFSSQLIVSIERNSFKQDYKLRFSESANDGVSDEDAIKLGEGYVSIAGVADGVKLSVDQRDVLQEGKEVKLYVKGWEDGEYSLSMKGMNSFGNFEVILIDRFADKRLTISTENENYSFHIDLDDPGSYGSERFSLVFDRKEEFQIAKKLTYLLYPNPFSERFHIKSLNNNATEVTVLVRNTLGKVLIKQLINLRDGDGEVMTNHLPTGVYIVQLIDKTSNKTIATIKAIKK